MRTPDGVGNATPPNTGFTGEDLMSEYELLFTTFAALVSFTVSSSAGLGGSLILVPALAAIHGTKEGVALAALLLAANNVAKAIAYRRTLPARQALVVVIPTMLGAFVGASLLLAAPEPLVATAVIVSIAATLVVEFVTGTSQRRIGVPLLSGGAGLTSGFSGTSGPLKGVAVRALGMDRRSTVGAATLASLAGDVTKSATFASDGYLGAAEYGTAALMVPVMVVGTTFGYRLNSRLGSAGYATWFWVVMGGYSLRLAGVLG